MKKWIHASSYEYTNMIDEAVPSEVYDLITTNCSDIAYSQMKSVFDLFGQDYKKFPSPNSMDSLNIEYDEDKGRFYRKWRPLVDKCKQIIDEIRPSGYGRNDYEKVKILELAKKIEYNFPYGWKNMP